MTLLGPAIDTMQVRARNLSFAYKRGETVFENIDLEIDEGDLIGLAGPSGSGKSTLLKVLAGLAPRFTGGVAAGYASIGGVDLPISSGDLCDRVGFVPQDPHAGCVADRVDDEIAFTAENIGLAETMIRERMARVAAECGISHLMTRKLANLSSGERQRVQIAAALVADPALLLLDEPVSQLDDEGLRSVASALRTLQQSGRTILVAEHRFERLGLDLDRILEPMGSDSPLAHARQRGFARGDVCATVAGASVELGGCKVLERVDLKLHAGEVVALAGANGSGKTTLLRALAGFLKPARGMITTPDQVAWVPQRPEAAFCRDRVIDELALTLRARKSKQDPQEILEHAGLAHLASRSPRHLSSGERLRVALCVLTAGDPELILLDEPTRGLDQQARRYLLEQADSWAQLGSAVLLATHDDDLINNCDRTLKLHDGGLL